MSLHRFFVQGPLPGGSATGWLVPLSERDVHHLSRVLRMGAGDRMMLAGTDGREVEAVVLEVRPEGVLADVPEAPRWREPSPRVALAQGLTRKERMEYAIQKTTEVGVAEIVPVAFARSVVKLSEERGEKRMARWRGIAQEAAKQSQRADVPLVHDATDLEGLVALASGFDVVLVPWEERAGSAPGIGTVLAEAGATAESSVLVVIGPEGGLEPSEVDALQTRAAGRLVSLGGTILRTETAALVAVALVSYELGGLGGRGR
jgi:16S rRNA (uracil1498-N3)-methyltransferase